MKALIEINVVAGGHRHPAAMKRATSRLSLVHVLAILLAALLLAAAILVATRPAAAEPQLDYSVKLAIKQHFTDRLTLNNCTHVFRYYSLDTSNWVRLGDESVRVQVVLFAEYVGKTSLYGNSELSRTCLGRDSGAAFLEPAKTYPTAGLVYTLSQWSQGWHVDRLEYQP